MNRTEAVRLVVELSGRAFLRGIARGEGRAYPPNSPIRQREQKVEDKIIDALCSSPFQVAQSAEFVIGARTRRIGR